ncbi:hypothetical protein [Sicyoidochytrium minutum DNA virus]|nr:hypothetical protein [Sicyoidochytrium minutum DNA virus]
MNLNFFWLHRSSRNLQIAGWLFLIAVIAAGITTAVLLVQDDDEGSTSPSPSPAPTPSPGPGPGPTPTPSPSPSPGGSDSDTFAGWKIGLIVGGVCLFILIIIGLWWFNIYSRLLTWFKSELPSILTRENTETAQNIVQSAQERRKLLDQLTKINGERLTGSKESIKAAVRARVQQQFAGAGLSEAEVDEAVRDQEELVLGYAETLTRIKFVLPRYLTVSTLAAKNNEAVSSLAQLVKDMKSRFDNDLEAFRQRVAAAGDNPSPEERDRLVQVALELSSRGEKLAEAALVFRDTVAVARKTSVSRDVLKEYADEGTAEKRRDAETFLRERLEAETRVTEKLRTLEARLMGVEAGPDIGRVDDADTSVGELETLSAALRDTEVRTGNITRRMGYEAGTYERISASDDEIVEELKTRQAELAGEYPELVPLTRESRESKVVSEKLAELSDRQVQRALVLEARMERRTKKFDPRKRFGLPRLKRSNKKGGKEPYKAEAEEYDMTPEELEDARNAEGGFL